MTSVPIASHRGEPLFASRPFLWLRVWAITQTVALVAALGVWSASAPAARAISQPGSTYVAASVAALVAYHVVGVAAYRWIIARPWVTAAFVPIGWFVVLATLRVHAAFVMLLLGAVLQGFIFLSFAWATGTLAMVTGLLIAGMAVQIGRGDPSLALARIGGVTATSVMIGTVFLYIHRANRDAAIRARLIAELEVAHRHLAERAHHAGIQDERQRLARDLHDTLAQGFTSVIRHLEAVELSFDSSNSSVLRTVQDARPRLAQARAVSHESLTEIRRLVLALRPTRLEGASLGPAIKRTVEQWSRATTIVATCTVGDLPPFTPDADVTLLRALQESLMNVWRHAEASRVSVTFGIVDELVLLSVDDNGRGFDEQQPIASNRMGLAGMRERVRPFGGRVLIESDVASGTSVTVALPVDAAVARA